MTENLCGTCTACCRVYAIPEFKTPAGKWCPNCDIGKGCKIYEARPERCVAYECAWLQGKKRGLPLVDELRPDRCKVVFGATTNERVMTAITMPGRPDAWKTKVVRRFIDRILQAGVSLAIGSPGAPTQLLLKPDGSQRVVDMTPPDEDGMQWSIGQDDPFAQEKQ